MAKKNYGSHTAEQLAKEVDALVALYDAAEREVDAARLALADAEKKVDAARAALDAAADAFVSRLPTHMRRAIGSSLTRGILERADSEEKVVFTFGPSDVAVRVGTHICLTEPCTFCKPPEPLVLHALPLVPDGGADYRPPE